jgi:hypothetical protein
VLQRAGLLSLQGSEMPTLKATSATACMKVWGYPKTDAPLFAGTSGRPERACSELSSTSASAIVTATGRPGASARPSTGSPRRRLGDMWKPEGYSRAGDALTSDMIGRCEGGRIGF